MFDVSDVPDSGRLFHRMRQTQESCPSRVHHPLNYNYLVFHMMAQPEKQQEEGEGQLYHVVKQIRFRRSKTSEPDTVPILLQDVNGPCPILAILNILLLRGQVQLPKDVGEVSQSKVVQILAEYLLDKNQALEDSPSTSDSTKANLQYNLADAISLLPRLTTGVDINVRFNDIRGIEFTADVAVFDLLGIDLVHGWLVDPQDVETTQVLGNKTYNEIVCDVITASSLSRKVSKQEDDVSAPIPEHGDITQSDLTQALASLIHIEEDDRMPCNAVYESETPSLVSQDSVSRAVNSMLQDTVKDVFKTPVDVSRATTMDTIERSSIMKSLSSSVECSKDEHDDKTVSALIAREFLDSNSSQLTVYGLTCLLEGLDEGQLAVFFRNNHFNVMLKQDGCLYILVTDQGYQTETDIVWEACTSVIGDTEFVTWNFLPFQPHKENAVHDDILVRGLGHDAPPIDVENDFRLALQLQKEEQALADAEQQQRAPPVKMKTSICVIR